MKTYNLYFHHPFTRRRELMTSVRMLAGVSRQQVIDHAVDQHNRVPLTAGTGFAPFEWEYRLKCSQVFCEPFRR
jgi:hypothetical protein